ncbi:hypothetical protein [Bifidobacterium callitrichidarum]|uniref:Uncharacterized protein n=1 Tax=Bifidobacterium callitrichidarum TaxID=2052941 RepID=A0A2U2NC53_9BIFI|nr:hypothetical protein [Bifidobacterium callitrichidarum]PWG66668.1 hypothetical protein DF196_01840 [Bifidobacterium callitrichidarum]
MKTDIKRIITICTVSTILWGVAVIVTSVRRTLGWQLWVRVGLLWMLISVVAMVVALLVYKVESDQEQAETVARQSIYELGNWYATRTDLDRLDGIISLRERLGLQLQIAQNMPLEQLTPAIQTMRTMDASSGEQHAEVLNQYLTDMSRKPALWKQQTAYRQQQAAVSMNGTSKE